MVKEHIPGNVLHTALDSWGEEFQGPTCPTSNHQSLFLKRFMPVPIGIIKKNSLSTCRQVTKFWRGYAWHCIARYHHCLNECHMHTLSKERPGFNYDWIVKKRISFHWFAIYLEGFRFGQLHVARTKESSNNSLTPQDISKSECVKL